MTKNLCGLIAARRKAREKTIGKMRLSLDDVHASWDSEPALLNALSECYKALSIIGTGAPVDYREVEVGWLMNTARESLARANEIAKKALGYDYE